MVGHELAIEQLEPGGLEPRDEMRERNLGGIGGEAEHAFPEKGRTDSQPIQAADQRPVLPRLDRMRVAAPVKLEKSALDRRVYPGVGPLGTPRRAGRDDLGEIPVDGDPEALRPNQSGERARDAESVQRQNRPAFRFDPEYVTRVPAVRHRKHADRIGSKQKVGIERSHLCGGLTRSAIVRSTTRQSDANACPAGDEGAISPTGLRRSVAVSTMLAAGIAGQAGSRSIASR